MRFTAVQMAMTERAKEDACVTPKTERRKWAILSTKSVLGALSTVLLLPAAAAYLLRLPAALRANAGLGRRNGRRKAKGTILTVFSF